MNNKPRFQSNRLLATLEQGWRSRPLLATTLLAASCISAPVYAQDVGSIRGKLSDNKGATNLAGATR